MNLRRQYEALKKHDIETLSSMFRDKARIFNGVRNKAEGENKRKMRNVEDKDISRYPKKSKLELSRMALQLDDLPSELLVECMRFVNPDLLGILTTVRLISKDMNRAMCCYSMRSHLTLTIPYIYQYKDGRIDIPSYFDGVENFKLNKKHNDKTLLLLRRSIDKLIMINCNRITDKGFIALKGIHTLNMANCTQKGITDKAFENLKGTIHTLNMERCYNAGITDKALENLNGTIHSLNISECYQFTDKGLGNIKGIHTLNMRYCHQIEITDKGLEIVKGTIKKLDITRCTQLTDKLFKSLKGINTLNMSHCYQSSITDKAFEYLKGSIRNISIKGCTQFTNDAFIYLNGTIHTLDMSFCRQRKITDEAFKWLTETIIKLDMRNCNPETVTERAFMNLIGMSNKLKIQYLHQNTVSKKRLEEIFKDQSTLKTR